MLILTATGAGFSVQKVGAHTAHDAVCCVAGIPKQPQPRVMNEKTQKKKPLLGGAPVHKNISAIALGAA
jgi:hypothetical protein